jgi:hypothetical protein
VFRTEWFEDFRKGASVSLENDKFASDQPSSRAEQLTRDKEAAVEHSYSSENFSELTKLLASAGAPHLHNILFLSAGRS